MSIELSKDDLDNIATALRIAVQYYREGNFTDDIGYGHPAVPFEDLNRKIEAILEGE